MTNDAPIPNQTGGESGGTNVVKLPAPQDEPVLNKVTSFAREHPMMTVAGGLAIGAVAAALIPRRNRKIIAGRTSVWSDAVAAAATALAQQAVSHATSAGDAVRESAGSLAHRAGEIGTAARERMETIGDKSLARAQSLVGRADLEGLLTDTIAAKAGQIRRKLRR